MKYTKWLAGGMGWVLGGPIGGILGFVIGSVLDGTGSDNHNIFAYDNGEDSQTTPHDFKLCLLILSAAVMKADEKVMKSELEFVRTFLQKQFGEKEIQEQIKHQLLELYQNY